MKRLLLAAIQFYQRAVSPWSGSLCRFEPSCSRYSAQAIEKLGLRKGLWMSAKRLLKCHPLHPGGWDPL